MHGVLTYKEDFLIRQSANDEEEFSAVEYILGGGEMKGWTVGPGDTFTHAGGRRGLVRRTRVGLGHRAGALRSVAGRVGAVRLAARDGDSSVGRDTFTMEDFVNQVMWDCAQSSPG